MEIVLDLLKSLKGPVSILSGCLGCFVALEKDEDDAICYMERWQTREALDHHLRSQIYGRILEAMEFSRVTPVVEFYEITEVGGLELIEKVRVPN